MKNKQIVLIISAVLLFCTIVTCCLMAIIIFFASQRNNVEFGSYDAVIMSDTQEIFISKKNLDFKAEDIHIIVVNNYESVPSEQNYSARLLKFNLLENNSEFIKLRLKESVTPDCLVIYVDNDSISSIIREVWFPTPSDSWMCSNFDDAKFYDLELDN